MKHTWGHSAYYPHYIQDSPKAKEFFSPVQTSLIYENILHLLRLLDNRFAQILSILERLYKLNDALRVFYFSFLTSKEK